MSSVHTVLVPDLGDFDDVEIIEVEVSVGDTIALDAPRIATLNDHGIGCTLSAAITALLPHHPMQDSVRRAKDYLSGALAEAWRLDVGHGHGPTHHFHALWR